MSGAPPTNTAPPSFSSFPDLDEPPSQSISRDRSQTKSVHRSSQSLANGSTKKGHDKSRKDKKERQSKPPSTKHQPRASEADAFIEDALKDIVPKSKDPSASKLDSVNRLWFEDRRGDEGNLRYGKLDSQSVAKYHRFGAGFVLGFPRQWKLQRGSKSQVLFRGQNPPTRYITYKEPPGNPRRLVIPQDVDESTLQADFIALPPDRKARVTLDDNHRITEGLKADSDMETSSSGDGYGPEDDEGTIPALPRPSFKPNNTLEWISLVERSSEIAPTPEARADISISIISKSFSETQSNRTDPHLRLIHLLSGARLWSSDKLAEEWEIALNLTSGAPFEDRIPLWVEWLAYRFQTGGPGSLEASIARIRAQIPMQAPRSDIFELYMLWLCAVGLASAGYYERGLALFQAQLELTLFCPQDLSQGTLGAKIAALEVFWDSEYARVGEQGSQGWRHTTGTPQTKLHSSTFQDRTAPQGLDPLSEWAHQEVPASKSCVFPKRSTDNQEDPYCIILFSDIKPFLIQPPRSGDGQFPLMCALLMFHYLGLPCPGLQEYLSLGNPQRAFDHVFAGAVQDPSTFFQRCTSQNRLWEVIHGSVVAREESPRSSWGPIKQWGFNVLSPLEGYGVQGEGRLWEPPDLAPLDATATDFIRRIFEQASPVMNSALFDQYWLSYEAAVNLKQSIKVSRSILSRHRDSLERWAAHAQLERIRGRVSDARKVYEVTLEQAVGSQPPIGMAKLVWDYAEMEWLQGNGEAAKALIIRFATAGQASGTVILRTKTMLAQARSSTLHNLGRQVMWATDGRLHQVVAFSNLSALFELLITCDVSSATSCYSLPGELSLSESSNSYLEESLAIASAKLVYNYVKVIRAPTPPTVFRTLMDGLIRNFPRNTILLGFWLESEKGETVWGRVRQMLGTSILKPSLAGLEVPRLLWGVWHETCKDKASWEVERTRNLLRRALDGERSRSSSTIWRTAISFELQMHETKRAKQLLYQAIRECPYDKALYLLAFSEPLATAFTSAELQQWANAMVERGVRLHINIDDYLEAAARRAGNAESDSEAQPAGGDRELEELLTERRRLLPF